MLIHISAKTRNCISEYFLSKTAEDFLGCFILWPEKIKTNLEFRDELLILADDLYNGYPYPKDIEDTDLWNKKYVEHTFSTPLIRKNES